MVFDNVLKNTKIVTQKVLKNTKIVILKAELGATLFFRPPTLRSPTSDTGLKIRLPTLSTPILSGDTEKKSVFKGKIPTRKTFLER